MGNICGTDDSVKTKQQNENENKNNSNKIVLVDAQKQDDDDGDDGDESKDRGIEPTSGGGKNKKGGHVLVLGGHTKPAAATTTTTTNPKPATTTNNSQTATKIQPPAGCELIKQKVRNVYDGDTLTLADERRVRFVFVDAPEIKEKEEGAQEAKALVKQLCDKKDIEIYVDPKEPSDKYDRIIGLIFVKDSKTGEKICVNEELLKKGLVNFYRPKGSEAFEDLGDEFLAAQSEAIKHRVGIWSDFVDDNVFKTKNGGSYHKQECENVSGMRLDKIKRSEAIKQGMSGCRTCHP